MTKNLYRLTLLLFVFSFLGYGQGKQHQNLISENVIFINAKDNISLSGILSLPGKKRTFPTAILISGNGKHKRDAEFGNHKPFLAISNHLTNNGIAVLRYDKRGVGQSTGDYDAATSFDLANDVQAAIDYLLTRKEIKKNQIGLIGHSEGGLIAPIVASAKGIDLPEIEKSQQLNREAFELVKLYENQGILNKKMTEYIEKIFLTLEYNFG